MTTNYDTLKEYEENKEPLPSYREWKKLQEDREILTRYLIKHNPKMTVWIEKHIGKVKQ
jgi:hypothetical protein